jgi:TetR/AcrR family transcriptional regulator, transcriptional repressor for nem operon
MPKLKQFDKAYVLAEAAAIFQKNGYNGTSIDEILKATKLSRSSLYDSFGDKHNLYLQSLEFYKNQNTEAFKSAGEKKLNGFQKIEFVFEQVVKHLLSHPDDNGCLMVNAAAEMSKQCEKTSQVVCNNKDEVQQLFTVWLEEAKKDKILSLSKPTKTYGQFLYNTLCGLKVLSQSGADKTELHNVVKLSLDALN